MPDAKWFAHDVISLHVTFERRESISGDCALIAAGIVGGLIASFATHRFTLSRERESGRSNRKREFRSFVVQFRSEVAEQYYPSTSDRADFYRKKVPALRHAAVTIADDFPRKRRAKFNELVSTAAGFTAAQVCEDDGRERVTSSLDAILSFLDT